MATIMDAPKAMEAADIFISVFTDVLNQVRDGQTQVVIQNPSQISPTSVMIDQAMNVREKLGQAISELLNTVIDSDGQRTVRDELSETALAASGIIREWLKTRKLDNGKLEAETIKLLEEVEDMRTRRHSDLQDAELNRQLKIQEIVKQKIENVDRLRKFYHDFEPNTIVNLVNKLDPNPKLLD